MTPTVFNDMTHLMPHRTVRSRSDKMMKAGDPSMRNLLETSSVAQRLDGEPSDGEPAFPRRSINLVPQAGRGRLRQLPAARRASLPERLVRLAQRLLPRQCRCRRAAACPRPIGERVALPPPRQPERTACPTDGQEASSEVDQRRGDGPPGRTRGRRLSLTWESSRSHELLLRSFS